MEKQEQFTPVFQPEQVNEQVEYLASIQDARTQKATPGARTVAALRRVSAENETILANVWAQVVLYEAARRPPVDENEIVDLFQSRQKKDDVMRKIELPPQLNTTDSRLEQAPRRSRRLLMLVAAALLIVLAGSFVAVFNVIHANNTQTALQRPSVTTILRSPTTRSTLPVPSSQVIPGPAANVIYSVGISNKIDPQTGIIPAQVNQFTVGEAIWLSCSARPPKDGTLTVKWYSNGNIYKIAPQAIARTKGQQTATISIVYGLPAEGKVEVYWNNQLAATVLFVVEPAAR